MCWDATEKLHIYFTLKVKLNRTTDLNSIIDYRLESWSMDSHVSVF